jgi:radical SAM enzyme (TIGR01210 family)
VCEISKEAARHVLRQTADRGMRLLFESRPEFVTPATVAEALSVNENLEIALGLESSNDRVLRYSINKGFSRADYETAAKTIADAGIDLRTYVLLKPPFLTEAEAIADSKETIELASRFSKTISLNPVNVQKGTLVEKLWRNWAYRPPWLWSVLDVLRNSQRDGRRLVCEPTGGGKERGAHNCGKCDETILASLKAFSESQDIGRLGSPDCEWGVRSTSKDSHASQRRDSKDGATLATAKFFQAALESGVQKGYDAGIRGPQGTPGEYRVG